MDSCQAVEKEIDKVIQKFSGIQSHSTRVLDDAIKYIEQLKSSIEEGKLSKYYLIFILLEWIMKILFYIFNCGMVIISFNN